MKRFAWILTLVGLMFSVSQAQTNTKNSEQTTIIAQGGYYRSVGTMPNHVNAFDAARRFGCQAATCELKCTADGILVVSMESEARAKKVAHGTYDQMLRDGVNMIPLSDIFLKYRALITAEQDNKKLALQSRMTGKGKPEEARIMRLILTIPACNDTKQQNAMLSYLNKILTDPKNRPLVELSSFDLELCRTLKDRFPNIPVLYLNGDMSPREMSKRARGFGAVYDYNTLHAHANWVKEAKSQKIPVVVRAATTESAIKEMKSMGIHTFLTDNPAMVSAWANNQPLVKLMSFNIRMSAMPKEDGDNAWGNRKEAVVQMLKDQDPDVFGVQEMLPDQQKYLRKELSEYRMIGVGREDGQKEGECMAIFYKKDRFALTDSGTFWLSQTPEVPSMGWDAACKRTVTYAQLKDKISGEKFYYFNTHLDHVGMIARQESVKLIADRIRKIVGDTNTVCILGGDMNSPLKNEIFTPLIGQKIKKKGKKAIVSLDGKAVSEKSAAAAVPMEVVGERSRAMMKSCRNTAWERDDFNTYNAYGKGPQAQIDHLFSTQHTENLIFKTVRQQYGVPYISDHYPIVLIFRLK